MREIFLHDLRWKLFSLFLALAIWFTVHRVLQQSAAPASSTDTIKNTYGSLPITVVSSTSDVSLYRVIPSEVTAVVAGPREAISALKASQIRVSVDLSGVEDTKDLKAGVEVFMPPGIALINVDPPSVRVTPPPKPVEPKPEEP